MRDVACYEQFLTSVSFCGLRLGVSRNFVLSVLGAPESMGPGGRGAVILAYEGRHIQVTVANDRVVHIGVYFRDAGRRRSPAIALAGLVLSGRTPPSEMCEWMSAAGLEWEKRDLLGGTRIDFSNGLVAIFDEGSLDSVQLIGD